MSTSLWNSIRNILIGGNESIEAMKQAESSFRWLAIFLGFIFAIFRFSSPFFGRDRHILTPTWIDIRMLAIIWALFAGLMHFPVGSSSDVEDLKTKLFLSCFVIIMTLTQLIITAFSVVHHFIAWGLHAIWPDLSDAFWFRDIRPKKSTRTAFQTSAILSMALSLIIVVCDDIKEEQTNSFCVQYMPALFAISNGNISESFFGNYFGRLSLIESPVGVLWISAITFYILQYTLQRTRKMVQLNQRRKKLQKELRNKIGNSLSRTLSVFSAINIKNGENSDKETETDENIFPGGKSPRSRRSFDDGNDSSSDFEPSGSISEETANKNTDDDNPNDHPSISFLPMTEWFSLQVAEVGFQLLLTLKLILNRFDMRMMEAAFMRSSHSDKDIEKELEIDERFAEKDELWFDWIADTGDGGDSTYSIARMLAQPMLSVRVKSDILPMAAVSKYKIRYLPATATLPRASLLLLGGDLAYPLGTMEEYENRLFKIFSFAMEPPPTYSPHDISFDGQYKNSSSRKLISNGKTTGPPIAYAIPGNHDWIDGLNAFNRCILQREWLGGWNLPQRRSYFAIKLPHKFWLFGFDNALNEDIDAHQYQYFARVAREKMAEDDKCIFATHEPTWVLDAYLGKDHSCPNIKHLMRSVLKGRVVIRLAGDIHNYMRHTATKPNQKESKEEGAPPTLIVSGGGGAFLHPTHSFPTKFTETKTEYELKCAYPSIGDSRFIGFRHLGGMFRMLNWRFDVVGSCMYFGLVASLLPRCSSNIKDIMDAPLYPDGIVIFIRELLYLLLEIFTSSYVSLATVFAVFIFVFLVVEGHKSMLFRISASICHAFAHISAALSILLLLEISVEVAHRDRLAGYSYYSSFEQFRSFEQKSIPDSHRTEGIMLNFVKELLRFLDLPEAMAHTRTRLCATAAANGYGDFNILTRYETIMYYFGYFLYMSILSVDVCSFIVGWYFLIMSSWFKLHWNESFSSARYPHRKHFIRFHITKTGVLESWVIGVDKVPTEWKKDPNFESTASKIKQGYSGSDPSILSYNSKVPSRWVSVKDFEALKPFVVDYFTVENNSETN